MITNKKITIKPRAVIFDFDGVIVDSLQIHVLAWQKAAQEFSNKIFDLQEIYKQLDQPPELIARYLAQNDEQKAKEIAQRKKAILLNQEHIAIPTLPGVWESVRYLKEKNIPFAIGSNAPKAFISNVLKNIGIDIPLIVAREDVTKAKPDPEIFILAAKKLNINTLDYNKILVFEDSTHGITAAKNAGMIPIGISSRHTIKELKDTGAQLVCAHLRDALDQKIYDTIELDY